MTHQKGFTLIELMIVIAIIGILASVALPAYDTYQNKARFSEVVSASTSCRNAVSEKAPTTPTLPAAGAWGCETGDGNGQYVGAIQTDTTGVVRVSIPTGTSGLFGDDTQEYLYFIPSEATGGLASYDALEAGDNVAEWVCAVSTARVVKLAPGTCSQIVTAAIAGYTYANL